MSKVKTLFSIDINNEYYRDQERNNDFDIRPTKSTELFFQRFKLKWFSQDRHCYKLLYINDSKNFINLLKYNICSLDFEIFCNKNDFYNYTDVKVDRIYHFTNENEYPRLHKDHFVSDADSVIPTKYQHNLFGFIKIFFKKIDEENNFKINLRALSSYWTYYISNKNFKIKNILKIMSSDNNFVFLNHKEKGDDLIYRSEHPIALRDKYDFPILLKYQRVGGESVEEILPSPNSYSKYVSGDNFFSDIEYTVI